MFIVTFLFTHCTLPSNMHFTILVTICVLVTITHAVPKEMVDLVMKNFDELEEVCLKPSNVTQDDVTLIISGQVPDSHEGKCLIYCMMHLLKFVDKQGKIDVENTKKYIETLKRRELYLEILKVCLERDISSDDPCENASDVTICIIENY